MSPALLDALIRSGATRAVAICGALFFGRGHSGVVPSPRHGESGARARLASRISRVSKTAIRSTHARNPLVRPCTKVLDAHGSRRTAAAQPRRSAPGWSGVKLGISRMRKAWSRGCGL